VSHIVPTFVVAGVCGLFIWISMHLAMIPWRRSVTMHWTERARLLWPARKSVVAAMLAGLTCAIVGGKQLFDWSFPMWLASLSALLSSLALFPSAREIEPRYGFRQWLREVAWALLLKGLPVLAAVYLMWAMPDEPEAADGWLFFTLFLTSAFLASGVWLPLVSRRCQGDHARAPMQQRLDRIAEEASVESGVVPRHVWLGETPVANAAAFPLIQSVVFTTRSMEILDDEECRAVMLHEFSHLRESILMGLLRVLSAVSFLAIVFVRPVMHLGGMTGLMALVFGYFLFQRLVGMAMRRMEHRADSAATGPEGESPAYARALEKLHEANQLPAVMPGDRMVHPHLYDRMEQAGVTPDYPRPLPPSRFSVVSLFCLVIFIANVVLTICL